MSPRRGRHVHGSGGTLSTYLPRLSGRRASAAMLLLHFVWGRGLLLLQMYMLAVPSFFITRQDRASVSCILVLRLTNT